MSKKLTAAESLFWYLVAFAALGFVVSGALTALFQLINALVPDIYHDDWYFHIEQGLAKFAIASLIVAGPVFYFFMRHINKHLSTKNLADDAPIRRWLTYILLFVASCWLIGDLIALVYFFLDGELTLKFLLKVAAVLLVWGAVFVYFFLDIKNKTDKARRLKNKLFGFGFLAALVAIIVTTYLVVLESPFEARQRKIDEQTAEWLDDVEYEIDDYYYDHEVLPENLEALQDGYYVDEGIFESTISYEAIEGREYRLCADFKLDSSPYDDWILEDWPHTAGRECFELEAYDYSEDDY